MSAAATLRRWQKRRARERLLDLDRLALEAEHAMQVKYMRLLKVAQDNVTCPACLELRRLDDEERA